MHMKILNIKTVIFVLSAVIILSLSLLYGCVTFTSQSTTPSASQTSAPVTSVTPINPNWTPPESNIGKTIVQLPSIADVVAAVKPSVVAINTQIVSYDFFNRPFTQEGAGSGWIIDSNGIIVTNNHVVEGAEIITVTTDSGDSYTADVNSISTDPLNDLAIIKIDAKNLPALKTGSMGKLRTGDWVIAIGNALGQGTRATEGIISQLGVALQVDQGQTLYNLIETSAAINPGNSGGPLVNLSGEVIGITSAKIATIGVEAMGYAISIDTAKPIIQELVNKGYVTRPWLGVGLYTVDALAIRQLKLSVDTGVVLIQVVSGGPADTAGLKVGDVIVSVDGTEVTTVEELTQILHKSTIGQALEIKYWRGNTQYTASVTPSESPRQ
jgi:serine protease Do